MKELGFQMQINTNITAIILMRVIPAVSILYIKKKQPVYAEHFSIVT